ncbi:DUF397 domain-containing protein [Streptomyces sp. NPDC052040]|uniref:DUF397 domain-containing protein n=1 Tax=Streptomyces sp. NPDC052040 TaxID=3365682 RepID=UPI0037CEDFC2
MLNRQGALTNWTKSSYSAVNGDCVEVKAQTSSSSIAVRDSKALQRPALGFAGEAWSAFVLDVCRGQD